VSLGGIATIDLVPGGAASRWPWQVVLRSSDPVTACWAASMPVGS
jgi:hypothetical protein